MKSAWWPVVALVLFGSACERIEARYDSLEEAVEAGAVERGWIPDFLPNSSAQIREFHDLDTNEGWLRFEYGGGDHEQLIADLVPVSINESSAAGFRDPGVSWWNQEQLLALAMGDKEGSEAYRTVEGNRLIVLLPARGEGYIWLNQWRGR